MQLPKEAGHLGVEILSAARVWTQKRALLRRALDSKSATPTVVDQRRKEYEKAARELEAVVMRLERMLQLSGIAIPLTGGANKKPFPWKEFLGMVAAGAKAVDAAVNSAKEPLVIDVEAKTVKDE